MPGSVASGTHCIIITLAYKLCSFWLLINNNNNNNNNKLNHKALPVGPIGRYTCSQTHNSALLSSLSKSVCRHKGNVLLPRNVTLYSVPGAGACNLLNQTYILTAYVKFPPYQHTNTRYRNKIVAIHLKFQNSEHKPNVSEFLSPSPPPLSLSLSLSLTLTLTLTLTLSLSLSLSLSTHYITTS